MAGDVLITKQLRMTLDFEVEVEEVTDESLRDYYSRWSNYEEIVGDAELWANLSRQISLQRALLEDEAALRNYLVYVAADRVDPSSDSRLCEIFGVGGKQAEEDILGPVFGRLGEEDARYFSEVSVEGALFESIEVLSQSFKVRSARATIEEVMPVAEGTFDETTG